MSAAHRTAWWVVAGVFAVVVVLLPERAPVVEALTGKAIQGVTLRLPSAYLALAPVCDVLDRLTSLTVAQHIALLVTLIVAFWVWRGLRGRRRLGGVRRAFVEVGAFVVFLAAVVAVYALGALVPRPMAKLMVSDPDVVAVDFHSHTAMSHDGHKSFTAPVNRAWHRDGGFDVAWITDHDSVRAAIESTARDPATAGQGTVILPGREVIFRHEHVIALSTVDPRTAPPPGRDSTGTCRPWPFLIQTIPENLAKMPRPGPGECPVVQAIELLDAAPKGISQAGRDRDRIVSIADSFHLALVASSDNHGWGRTAVGWSLLRIPGWRSMTPDSLGARIVEKMRREGPSAVQVAERRLQPRLTGGLQAVSAFATVASLFGGLSRAERISWLIWILAAVAIVRRVYRRT